MFASLASLGLIASAIYSLRIVRKIFFEKKAQITSIKDLSARESFILGAMVIAIFFTRLYPRPVIYTVKLYLKRL
jgi:NADH-quinone oxidoreductase subunit M